MQLKSYQKFAFNKLLKYNKSFVFWTRNTGKTYLMISIIENFVQNNRDKDILFIVNNNTSINNTRKQFINDVPYFIIEKIGNVTLYLKNNNLLRFCSVDDRFNNTLYYIKPDLIICDDFYIQDLSDVAQLLYYIDSNKCKCIFTSNNTSIKLVEMFDYKNDFYINIMPYFNDNNESDWNTMNDLYVKKLKKQLDYKPEELIDYYDIIFQRKQKLKILNNISNGS